MSEIQQNRYDQLLRRVCDLKGPGSKVSWSVGDLLPVLDVEQVPIELLALQGSRLCVGRVNINAGGAGFFAQAVINAPLSGAIARILGFTVSTDTAQNIFWGPTQQAAGPIGGQQGFADGRLFGSGTTYKITGFNNLLVTGGGLMQRRDDGAAGFEHFPEGGIDIATPEAGFQVSTQLDNTVLRVGIMWVERTALPSELNI